MIFQKKSKLIGRKKLAGKKIWLVLLLAFGFGFFAFANFALADSSRILPTAYHESTYCASGCDYSSLQAWEDATDNDLVTAQMGEVLTCYEGVYNDSVALSGAITNASYFRVIRAASGAKGTPTSGVRFVKVVTASTYLFNIGETYASVQDIAIKLKIGRAHV